MFKLLLVSESLKFCFPKRQVLDSSKLREEADDNFEFDENGRNFSKWVEYTVTNNFSFFKRFVLETRKSQGLFGKGLRVKRQTYLCQPHLNIDVDWCFI